MGNILNKKLAVFIHLNGAFAPAGLLEMSEDREELLSSNFTYGLRYLDRSNAIDIDPASLSIENKETIRERRLFPANALTMFGAIRDASPDGWGRRVIESRLKVKTNSLPESTYLLESGSERAGALDIRPSVSSPFKAQNRNTILQIEYLLEAADRIEQGYPVPAQLQDIFDAGSSMGGMRPKAVVKDENNIQWIAKFPSLNDRLNVPVIEAATMKLAFEAGMNVPEVKTMEIGRQSVMLIQRFDRSEIEGVQHRHHMVSALTMIGCHETASITKSYWDICDRIKKNVSIDCVCDDQKELFSRMVFNIFVTNNDDHLRNHAFLWDTKKNSWRLSPLYDVMPHPVIGTDRDLHLGVGGQGRLANLDNALSGYARFGLSINEAKDVIDRIWITVRQWKYHFEQWGVPDAQIQKVEPAFRHIDDILSSSLKRSQQVRNKN
jgi:serine/threonine-protein kinase HipA